jgi:hypothetical protein
VAILLKISSLLLLPLNLVKGLVLPPTFSV